MHIDSCFEILETRSRLTFFLYFHNLCAQVFSLKILSEGNMITTMFHDLPKTNEDAEEFFKRYQENFLNRNLSQCLEKAKDVSDIITAGINTLKSEVYSKEQMLKVRHILP